jgi:hypothetical protein
LPLFCVQVGPGEFHMDEPRGLAGGGRAMFSRRRFCKLAASGIALLGVGGATEAVAGTCGK